MTLPAGHYEPDDPVYLDAREYREPKEAFKHVVRVIEETFGSRRISIVDIGCASGAFLSYALGRLSPREAVGVDISPEHLAQGRSAVAGAEFVEGSIFEPERLGGRAFDVCTCIGTIALFDDLELSLGSLLAHVAPGGALLVHDLVNRRPVDVLMRLRRSGGDNGPAEWRPGFNTWSRETYVRTVAVIDPALVVDFFPFAMPFAIEPTGDPLRAWTIRTAESEHQIVVGTGQLLDFGVVRIRRP